MNRHQKSCSPTLELNRCMGGESTLMGPRQAAAAIRMLGVSHVVPIHYATFPVLTGTPEALAEHTSDLPDLSIYALKPGETLR